MDSDTSLKNATASKITKTEIVLIINQTLMQNEPKLYVKND